MIAKLSGGQRQIPVNIKEHNKSAYELLNPIPKTPIVPNIQEIPIINLLP